MRNPLTLKPLHSKSARIVFLTARSFCFCAAVCYFRPHFRFSTRDQ